MRLMAALLATGLLAAGCTSGGGKPPPSTGTTNPSTSPRAPGQAKPALRILSPHDGETVHLPGTVQVEVDATPAASVVRFFAYSSPTGYHRDYPVHDGHGEIPLPDDKTLTGHRDLTFCLAAGDTLLPDTCSTMKLVLVGRK